MKKKKLVFNRSALNEMIRKFFRQKKIIPEEMRQWKYWENTIKVKHV